MGAAALVRAPHRAEVYCGIYEHNTPNKRRQAAGKERNRRELFQATGHWVKVAECG